MKDLLLVAILVKNKSEELPLFLECLEKQTVDKKRLVLYIRSNDNIDNSIEILENWLNIHGDKYHSIVKDYRDIDAQLKEYGYHQWDDKRFRILGKIRNDSIKYAMDNDMDYIVIDCDNFLKHNVIESLWNSGLPVVGPLLKLGDMSEEHLRGRTYGNYYSNYHYRVDNNGYFSGGDDYNIIFEQKVRGYIKVGVIHCTYLIRHKFLKYCNYLEKDYHIKVNGRSHRHEYVVFSDNLRAAGIDQFLDNRKLGGLLVLLEKDEKIMINYEDVVFRN